MDGNPWYPAANHDHPDALRPDLRGWQIFFILASVIIGEGIFSGDREALEVAGPAGTLVALGLVGLLAISVMGCVSELVQLFPVPNAIVEYIREFLDEDLALCCGFAYWYTWSSVFSGLYLRAVQFTSYWTTNTLWGNLICVFAPFIMIVINLCGVNTFGIIETVGGVLKILLVFGTGILMYILHSIPDKTPRPEPIYDGFEADAGLVNSKGAALFFIIPNLAYSFLGVESVSVTTFEARSIPSLRGPSRSIAWVITFLYGFTLISELLVFSWMDPTQPFIYGNQNITQSHLGTVNAGEATIAAVVTKRAGFPQLAGFLNACYMFSCFSAANSALYVASRTLYGLALKMPRRDTRPSRWFKKLSTITSHTRVPALAIVVSGLAFFWLPLVVYNLPNQDVVYVVDEILVVTASVMCLLVWAALCAAFLRFRYWFSLCKNLNPAGAHALEDYARFDRTSENYKARTGVMFLQPALAWLGLFGSLLVVLVFTTATFWNGNRNWVNYVLAFVPWIIFLAAWILRKLWRLREHSDRTITWFKTFSAENVEDLIEALNHLEINIPNRSERTLDHWGRKLTSLFFWQGDQNDGNEPRNSHQESVEANGFASQRPDRSLIEMHSFDSGWRPSGYVDSVDLADSPQVDDGQHFSRNFHGDVDDSATEQPTFRVSDSSATHEGSRAAPSGPTRRHHLGPREQSEY